MHRVELKVSDIINIPIRITFSVPNAPCGVERRNGFRALYHLFFFVPNAPCGVERGDGGKVGRGKECS